MILKKLPYWFKFGFVFSIIFLIIGFIYSFAINRLFSGESFFGFIFIILYALPSMFFPSNFYVLPIFGLITCITIFFVYFILGLIIGLIVQKIKNKREKSNINKTGIKCVIFLIFIYIVFLAFVYYLQVPKSEKDCSSLPDAPYEYNKDLDRNWCFSNLAEKKLDSDICEMITNDEKNSCLLNVAIETNNKNICEKIKKEYLKDNCLEFFGVKRDLGTCERKQNLDDRDYCLLNLAMDTDNLEICEKIKKEEFKKQCLTFRGY